MYYFTFKLNSYLVKIKVNIVFWTLTRFVKLGEYPTSAAGIVGTIRCYAFNGVNFTSSLPNPVTHTHNLGVKPEFYETLVYVADNIDFTTGVRQTVYKYEIYIGFGGSNIREFRLAGNTNNTTSFEYSGASVGYSSYMKITTKRTY